MPTPQRSHDTLTGMFREIVLVLGGVFALRGTDDETIRQVAAGLARVWSRARARKNREPGENRAVPHPAIAALLHSTEDEDRRRLRGNGQHPNRRSSRHGR